MPKKKSLLVRLLEIHNWAWDVSGSPKEYIEGCERDHEIKALASELGPEGWWLFWQYAPKGV